MKAIKERRKKEPTLIPVSEFVKGRLNRRGFQISQSYIYRLIRKDMAGELPTSLDFSYKQIGQQIFIVKD